jgi:anti-sigma B factor antagonist
MLGTHLASTAGPQARARELRARAAAVLERVQANHERAARGCRDAHAVHLATIQAHSHARRLRVDRFGVVMCMATGPWQILDLEVPPARDGEPVVVRAAGEVDISSAGALEACLGPLVTTRGATVLDLADVSFMDASGLRALVRAQRRAKEAGSSFSVRCPSDAVVRVLKIGGVFGSIAIEP